MTEVPNIRMMHDWVLVRHDDTLEKERMSEGGILVPGGSYTAEHELMTWGDVVAVGPGRWNRKGTARIPMETKPGDRVCYQRFTKQTQTGLGLAEIIGDEFAIVQEVKDIVAVEEPE